jgi:beta-galactosidase
MSEQLPTATPKYASRADDPFLVKLYDSLHDTPLQRKFRSLRPLPVGVVFIQWPGMDWEEMRRHLRLMKELGFTCLKGIGLLPGFDMRRFMHLALDEGIIPWWYGEAGWERSSGELLDKLGIPRDTPVEKLREHPAWLKHQDTVMRRRIDRTEARPHRVNPQDADPAAKRWEFSPARELKSAATRIEEAALPAFAAWLRRRYGTLEKLAAAWNARGEDCWSKWEDAAARMLPGPKDHDYRRYKDAVFFKIDTYLNQMRERLEEHRSDDPEEPLRAGGEMSLFLPLIGRGVDMEGIARLMGDFGSLYPSTHLAWHFDRVNYEIPRPVYMYSSMMADAFKGGWSATWESTGGPQQISGDKGWSEYAKQHLPAYTVDAGVMTQLMLTYLAAGYRGFGFWCWSPRPFGRECGEYSLLDRNLQPGPRARRVGRIGQAARRLRDELWQARKEPLAGVLWDQENDIQWSVMADFGREILPDQPTLARVGVGRALINANVPWEYVTADNLRKGLADRYRIIYLPAMLCVTADLFGILSDYVSRGGRLVMDLPGYYLDENARITATGKGSLFEKVFGATLDDYQYSSNVPRTLAGQRLTGFVADCTATTGRVLERYDNGLPGVMENQYGAGQAALLGCEASLLCARPGNVAMEELLVRWILGPNRPPYSCGGAIVYRLAAPAADHYFFINDGPACSVKLDTGAFKYRAAGDPVTQTPLLIGAPVELEAYSGRWLRFEKDRGKS